MLTMDQVLQRARPVLPVLVIEDVGLAVDLALALKAGGIEVLEVTLRTTCALTRMQGSQAPNVLPDTAWAGYNLRLLPGDTPDSCRERLESIVDDPRVKVELVDASLLEKYSELEKVRDRIRAQLRTVLQLDVEVTLVSPNTLKRFEGKAKRVTDLR